MTFSARAVPTRILSRSRRFIPEVEGLRFVAVMAVMLYHLSGYTLVKHMAQAAVQPAESWIPSLFSLGHYGVQLFFVLSGFLLATPFAKWRLGLGPKPSLRTYFLRRLTRLEPPFIVLILLTFAGGMLVYGVATGWSRWPQLLATLLYQHNLIFGQPNLVSVVTWSLEIEVQFYCLAPALTALFALRGAWVRRGVLLAIMLAAPCLRSFVAQSVQERFNCLPWHFEFFAAGFFLADVFLVDWREEPVRSWRWDLVSLAAWPALVAVTWANAPAMLIAPVMLLACLGALKGAGSSWILSRPFLTTIGGMCYSMYLVHYAVISFTGRVTSRVLWGSDFVTRFAVDALVAIPVTLAVTAAAFVFLERPCMNPTWFSHWRRRISAPGLSGQDVHVGNQQRLALVAESAADGEGRREARGRPVNALERPA